jgi:predicted nucleic acid-binding Zn ribbon protein
MNQELRAQILAEWRGIEEPLTKPDRVVSVSSILEQLLPALGLESRLDETAISELWKELVGEFIASNATPVGIKNGCLFIRVVHPTLRYELDLVWKARILSTLQEKFGKQKIRSVRFVV